MSVRPIIRLNLPVGEPEVVTGWGYDRDTTVKVIFPGSDHVYHMVRTACALCHREVTLQEIQVGDAYSTRINGDSYYGYEMYHREGRCH